MSAVFFHGWRYNIVDWKWGHTELAFAKLSAAIDVFFAYFDMKLFALPLTTIQQITML